MLQSQPRPQRFLRILRTGGHVLALVLAGAGLALANGLGLLGMTLGLLLAAAAVAAIAIVAVSALRRRVCLEWLTHPLRRGSRRYALQFVLRGVVWVLTGYLAVLAYPRSLVSQHWATVSYVGIWIATAVLVLAALAPLRKVSWINNIGFGLAAVFLAAQALRLATPPSEAVTLDAPVTGTWMVGSGGRSALLSHHWPVVQQRHALDLVIPFERSSAPSPELSAYPAYEQPVYAPAGGVVRRAVGDLPDLPIGTRDPIRATGNHLVIELADRRFILLAHLRSGSVRVNVGDAVAQGQQVAQVGNSGNTLEPHLHLQVQSGPDLLTADGRAFTDLVTYPMLFEGATRFRFDRTTTPAEDLRRNDLVTFERVG